MLKKSYIKKLKGLYDKSIESRFKKEHTKIKLELNKKDIANYFRDFYPVWAVEDFYDSEPDFDDEEYNMYLDYQMKHCPEEMEITGMGFWAGMQKAIDNDKPEDERKHLEGKFSTQEHTEEELEQAYEKVKKKYEEYEERKLEFNNWEELYEKGVWFMTQQDVEDYVRDFLREVIKKYDGIDFRTTKIWVDDNSFILFNFTRDLISKDTRIFFVRRGYHYDYKKDEIVEGEE